MGEYTQITSELRTIGIMKDHYSSNRVIWIVYVEMTELSSATPRISQISITLPMEEGHCCRKRISDRIDKENYQLLRQKQFVVNKIVKCEIDVYKLFFQIRCCVSFAPGNSIQKLNSYGANVLWPKKTPPLKNIFSYWILLYSRRIWPKIWPIGPL